MTGHGWVAAADVAALLELVAAEVPHCEQLDRRRERIVAGLARLLGADRWHWTLERPGPPGAVPLVLAQLEVGWCGVAGAESALARFGPGRRHLLAWREPVPMGLVSSLRLSRLPGRPGFGRRERALAELVGRSLPWLHGESLSALRPSPAGLSRRERQVLALLLQGEGKKQIATKLGISEFTVGDYAKAIHRHFGVHSRGKLAALFILADGLTLGSSAGTEASPARHSWKA